MNRNLRTKGLYLHGHTNDYTHSPSQANYEVVRIKNSIRNLAEATHGSPPNILATALSLTSDATLVNLPKLFHLKRQ